MLPVYVNIYLMVLIGSWLMSKYRRRASPDAPEWARHPDRR
jgi:hypothetical protein